MRISWLNARKRTKRKERERERERDFTVNLSDITDI